ncbi:hypothetical protein ABIB57_005360 [Devosia sp. UYZn731]|uniref:hypothetical protein n=1 Tax=Devosia sp. UYZn731 TaxID=3156345 RepID=UPI00339A8447
MILLVGTTVAVAHSEKPNLFDTRGDDVEDGFSWVLADVSHPEFALSLVWSSSLRLQ